MLCVRFVCFQTVVSGVVIVIVVGVVENAGNVSENAVQSFFSFVSCIDSSSVFKEGLNPLPVLDRSRDHCYQERCPLWVGRPESRTFISFLYHKDSLGSNSLSFLDPL